MATAFFSPDPIRVLVVDANGRLLARSYRSQTMVLSCSHGNACRAFDVMRRQVLEIDPAAFREGPAVPHSGDELWTIERDDESWGFRIRPASLTERVEGELILAKEWIPVVALLFAAGSLVAVSGLLIFRHRPNIKVLDIVKIVMALMLLILAGLISMILILVTPITGSIFLGSIGAGLVFVLVVRYELRKMRIKPPSPSPAI